MAELGRPGVACVPTVRGSHVGDLVKLDELVERACSQVLSEGDLRQLCLHAQREGLSETVLLRLMRAGTAASRTNLMAAKSLTSSHLAQRHDVGRIKKEGMESSNGRMHHSLALNLPFLVTDHAFERFLERHPLDGGMDFLLAEARSSAPIRNKTMSGDSQWVGQSGIVFVTRRDQGKPLPVCVTVLPFLHGSQGNGKRDSHVGVDQAIKK